MAIKHEQKLAPKWLREGLEILQCLGTMDMYSIILGDFTLRQTLLERH